MVHVRIFVHLRTQVTILMHIMYQEIFLYVLTRCPMTGGRYILMHIMYQKLFLYILTRCPLNEECINR